MEDSSLVAFTTLSLSAAAYQETINDKAKAMKGAESKNVWRESPTVLWKLGLEM